MLYYMKRHSVVHMQFLAALIVGIIALLMAMFFIPRIQDTLHLSVSTTTQEANVSTGVSAGNAGIVKGASTSRDTIEFIRSLPEASMFTSLFDRGNIASMLSATGTYTFFVPTDSAFASSSLQPISLMSVEDKERLIAYHIVPDRKASIDDVVYGTFTMLSRDKLTANIFQTDAYVDSNTHVLATYEIGDSVIYVIDHVMLPPERRPFPF